MVVRDLGYRAYEGRLLSPSHNVWVLWRYGLKRAWSSWFVKLSILFCWTTALAPIGFIIISFYMGVSSGMGNNAPAVGPEGATLLPSLFNWQLWLFVSLITVKIGASAVAEDLAHKAFSFFFSKPVSRVHYLGGRIGAIGSIVFAVSALPALLVVLALCLTAPPEHLSERAWLVMPSLTYALVIAVVASSASVAVSSLSRSRALTMTGWLLLWIVPHILSGVAGLVTDKPWLKLVSLPALLDHFGQTLFRPSELPIEGVQWFVTAGVLAVIVGVSLWLADWRLRSVEVVQ